MFTEDRIGFAHELVQFISTYPRCAEILSHHLKTTVEVSKKLLIQEPNANLKKAYLKANSFEFETQVREALQETVSQDLVDRLPEDPWIVRDAWYRALIRYALTVVIPQEANEVSNLIYGKELLIQFVQDLGGATPFLGLIVYHDLIVKRPLPEQSSEGWRSVVFEHAHRYLTSLVKEAGERVFLEGMQAAASEMKESWEEVKQTEAIVETSIKEERKKRLKVVKKGRHPQNRSTFKQEVFHALVSFIKRCPSLLPTQEKIARQLKLSEKEIKNFPKKLQRHNVKWKQLVGKAKSQVEKRTK